VLQYGAFKAVLLFVAEFAAVGYRDEWGLEMMTPLCRQKSRIGLLQNLITL